MKIFGTETFTLEDAIEGQATKTLQEAAEFYEAARKYQRDVRDESVFTATSLQIAIDEGADVIQTVLNAFEMMGLYEEDVYDAMERCMERNRRRGRL